MDNRKILCGLAIKYSGDWRKINEALHMKEYLNADELLEYEKKCESEYLTILDSNYPINLDFTGAPPFVLFYKGDISLINHFRESVSVIGTRNPTLYGIKQTGKIVRRLVDNDIVIVSGLAKGIDGVAHQVALKHHGKTIAVLGSGINNMYPSDNVSLYEQICDVGLVISEYPNSTPPVPTNFIARNRIIAALSKGVLVTEATGTKSGTLSTVSYALRYNRDVMCVPYHTDEDSICNRLIREGAQLVENYMDVLKEINYKNLLYK